jgi:rhodanese-related sulfurtransferase
MDIDLAYAPPYAPALGNVIVAAHVLQNKLDESTKGILPMEVKQKVDRGDDLVFIDVRPIKGRDFVCIETCQNIPLGMLSTQSAQFSKDKEIITSCQIGRSAAQAYRILKNKGFHNVRYMDGGITTWPDPKPVSKK